MKIFHIREKRKKEIKVMTIVETGGGCSNANMCQHIGLICDHAKVITATKTRTRIITGEKKKKKKKKDSNQFSFLHSPSIDESFFDNSSELVMYIIVLLIQYTLWANTHTHIRST